MDLPNLLQQKSYMCWLTFELKNLDYRNCAIQELILFCNNVHKTAAIFLQFIFAHWVPPSSSSKLDYDLRAKWTM
jgi:hypothetical protein